jgi:hypothetical protein
MGRRTSLVHYTRKGLDRLTDGVLTALVTRDPAYAALSHKTRYTENGQELAIGDGLWGSADRLGTYRHHFGDLGAGSAVTFTSITEGGVRSLLVIRIKAKDGVLLEIETIVARPDPMGGRNPFPLGPELLDTMLKPDKRWNAAIMPSKRMGRGDLRRIANLYFEGLENNDGKGEYPFADDCIRIENGSRTTAVPGTEKAIEQRDPETPYLPDFRAMSAKEQFETGYFRFVTRIRERRFVVIDEELGVVVALAFFDHNGTVRDYQLADGTPVKGNIKTPFSWQIAEAFRIEDGRFTRIEAMMAACPYGMKSGWPLAMGDIA